MATVATIADLGSGNYKIVATSSLEADEGVHTLILRVTFVNYPLTTDAAYPKADTNFSLTITPAVCDCSLITWDNPTIQTKTTGLMITPVLVIGLQLAVANEASKSATPAIRACYRNSGTCSLACTFTV